MTERRTQHVTFVIQQIYDASPASVFAAWSTTDAKARWFKGGARWKEWVRELDFRVGGRERLLGAWSGVWISDFRARYRDIVPNERIVYSYEMHLDQTRISVSLATVELEAAGASTRLTYTEQTTLLDGYEEPGARERSTRALLRGLEQELRREALRAMGSDEFHPDAQVVGSQP